MYGNRQLDGEAGSTLHVGIARPTRFALARFFGSFHLGRPQFLLGVARPGRFRLFVLRISTRTRHWPQLTPRYLLVKVTEVMELLAANAFHSRGLRGIC